MSSDRWGDWGATPMIRWLLLSESVRKVYKGLQSRRSMRRMEASRRNASALSVRFSKSLASTATIEPCQGALDHPAHRQHLEPLWLDPIVSRFPPPAAASASPWRRQ